MLVDHVKAPGGLATVRTVESEADLADWARWVESRASQPLGLDLETNALDPWDHGFQVRTVQTADGLESWVCPVEINPYLISGMLLRHPMWVCHYAEADLRFGVRGLPDPYRLVDAEPHLVDTQAVLAVYDPRTVTTAAKRDRIDVRIPRPKGLKEISARLLGPELQEAEHDLDAYFREIAPKGHRSKSALKAYGFAHADVFEPRFRVYAGLDPLVTIRLWWLMRRELEARGQWQRACLAMYDQWQVDLQTLRGLPIDGPYARWLDGELREVIAVRSAWFDTFSSDEDIPLPIPPSGQGPAIGLAFEALGVKSPVMREGKPSWDRSALAQICEGETAATYPESARWLARAVLDVRRAGKFAVTYVKPMLEALGRDGHLHPSSRAYGTVTTRETAQRPPVHQLPKRDTRVRAAVRAWRGWALVTADFRQGEPFVMAALSGDLDYLRDLETGDINARIAAMVYGHVDEGGEFDPAHGKEAGTPHYAMRQAAKFAWLAACYGAAPAKVAVLLGVPVERGGEIRARWRAAYPRLWAYADEMNRQTAIRVDSGAVVPLWDRFRVDDATGELVLRTWDDGRPKFSRLGLNAATQTTQADLLRFAKHRLRARGLAWALRFSLHDELLIMVPAWMAPWAAEVLEDCMTVTYRGVTVRCEATIEGRTWLPQPQDFDRAELAAVDDEDG